MQPATPLPWNTAHLDWRIIEGPDDLVIADVRSPQQYDAEYLAHAANAYPKLVEALRVALVALGNEGHHPGISKPLTDGLNLLTEVGEKI